MFAWAGKGRLSRRHMKASTGKGACVKAGKRGGGRAGVCKG